MEKRKGSRLPFFVFSKDQFLKNIKTISFILFKLLILVINFFYLKKELKLHLFSTKDRLYLELWLYLASIQICKKKIFTSFFSLTLITTFNIVIIAINVIKMLITIFNTIETILINLILHVVTFLLRGIPFPHHFPSPSVSSS